MCQHLPRIITDNVGGPVKHRRLQGIFHACRSMREAETEFENDEDSDNFSEKMALRRCFQSALGQWTNSVICYEDADVVAMLDNLFKLHFSSVSRLNHAEAIGRRCRENLFSPFIGCEEQLASFHQWGQDAGSKFWKSLWEAGHPQRNISFLILEPEMSAKMAFREGSDEADHAIAISLQCLVEADFDYFRWFMLLPLYFTHEYVSHIFPIDLRNHLFQEGWLLGTVGAFLANSKVTALEMPISHARAYDEFGALTEVPRPLSDVALAGYDFYIHSIPAASNALMGYNTALALVPKSCSSQDRRRASRFAEEMRKIQKDPFQKRIALSDISLSLSIAWGSI